jgi:hypothetical protein
MSFVPIVFIPPPPPSPRAQELARRLAELIEQFRSEHPDASGAEVRQALQLAAPRSASAQGVMVATLLLTGLLLLGTLLFVFLS